MKTPIIVVNYKTYREATGDRAIALTKAASEVSEGTGVSIAVAPSQLDLRTVIQASDIPVLAQHIDPVRYGSNTGHVPAEYVKYLGAEGTLVNHSEKTLNSETIKDILEESDRLGLESILCVDTVNRMRDLIELGVRPTFIAIEPPELIGSGRAVSKYKPELISEAAQVASRSEIPLLCGAGIVEGRDVKKASDLGSEGILVASGVVKAEDPSSVLEDFAANL